MSFTRTLLRTLIVFLGCCDIGAGFPQRLLQISRQSLSLSTGTEPQRPSFANNLLPLLRLRNDDDDGTPHQNDNILIESTAKFAKLASRRTPGLPFELAFGYPMVLLLSALVLPFGTFLVLGVSFGAFSYLGKRLVIDDMEASYPDRIDEDPSLPVDLVALGAAIASTSLLGPTSQGGGLFSFSDLVAFLGLSSIIAIVASMDNDGNGARERTSFNDSRNNARTPEEELLDMWDSKWNEQEGE